MNQAAFLFTDKGVLQKNYLAAAVGGAWRARRTFIIVATITNTSGIPVITNTKNITSTAFHITNSSLFNATIP